jgi:uncharacterized protein (TIRG00374 family)
LSLGVLAVLARVVDWRHFLTAVETADVGLLAIAYVLYVLDRALMSYKWGLLLRVHGLHVPLWQGWSIYSAASFASTFLPSTVGADMLRAAWSWRRGLRSEAAVAAVVVERAIGFLASFSLSVAAVVYLSASAAFAELAAFRWIAVALFVLAAAAVVLSFDPRVHRVMARALPGAVGRGLLRWLERFEDAYTAYRAERSVLWGFSALTLAEQIVTLAMTYLVALAIGIGVPPIYFAATCSVAFLASRLPISLDGLGILEGAVVVLLGRAGVDPAEAVAFALLSRVMAIAAYALGALCALRFTDLTLRDLRARRRAP